jgi:hypothetical protein
VHTEFQKIRVHTVACPPHVRTPQPCCDGWIDISPNEKFEHYPRQPGYHLKNSRLRGFLSDEFQQAAERRPTCRINASGLVNGDHAPPQVQNSCLRSSDHLLYHPSPASCFQLAYTTPWASYHTTTTTYTRRCRDWRRRFVMRIDERYTHAQENEMDLDRRAAGSISSCDVARSLACSMHGWCSVRSFTRVVLVV